MGVDEVPVRKSLAEGSPQSDHGVIDAAVACVGRSSPGLFGPLSAAPDAILVQREGREQAKLATRKEERPPSGESDLVGPDLKRPRDKNGVGRQLDVPMLAVLSREVVTQL
jgi:hypothetical protein